MNQDKLLIEVTHATLNSKVFVARALIFSFYWSDTHKATLLLAVGGAMLPVKESVDEIKSKLQG